MALNVHTNVPRPVLAVYSQNWPAPSRKPDVGKKFLGVGKSLNSDWVQRKSKQASNQILQCSEKEALGNLNVRAVGVPVSAKQFMDDELENAKDFKATLQLFRQLSKQIHDAGAQSRPKIYSFKPYLSDGRRSGLCRSQLAVALNRREIPQTYAPHEPITDQGALNVRSRPCSHYGNREREADEIFDGSSPSPLSPQSLPPRVASPLAQRPVSNQSKMKPNTENKPVEKNSTQKIKDYLSDKEKVSKKFIEMDPEFKKIFRIGTPKEEDFPYLDAYPEAQNGETLKELVATTEKDNLFIHRLIELRHLQEETVQWENIKTAPITRSKSIVYTNASVINNLHKGQPSRPITSKSSASNSSLSSRTAFQNGNGLTRQKSSISFFRTGSSQSSRNSTPKESSANDTVSNGENIQTLRKGGFTPGTSFIPGSMLQEVMKPDSSDKTPSQNSKEMKPTSTKSKTSVKDSSSYCTVCPVIQQHSRNISKHQCNNQGNSRTTSPGYDSRTPISLKSSEVYDIVELASTFEPPCQDKINKSRPTTGRNASASRGILLHKNCFSQRKISLTAENMSIKGVSPLNKSRPPTAGRCKSARKSAKRRPVSKTSTT